ncbi:S-formylglutathione hydrolase FrmB [Butyrivibrio sp. ob235]|uniref:alpha/beta hydrolase n=1 Tax=unclassified Butyrivibrio TaxID=2639466 RepID=UPI0003B38379|nr:MULTISPECIES: alpha/beta hydrolase-fold protein [unclassified Butyrivibrio]SEL70127.1 S-formylglutathione hydrolase FrmB [Butyrivibrio sp. ob235]
MASGTLRYYSLAQGGQVNINYSIPADTPDFMVAENPNFKRPMKTLYLLHGYSGNESDWIYSGVAEDLASTYNLAVIMITAGNNFYLDRKATGHQYCTFAGKEVVEFTRKLFGLSDKKEDTFIAGLSMGGFGALHTGLAFPETFGGIVALSSALIIHEVGNMKPGEGNDVANYEYYSEVFGDTTKVVESDANPEVLYKRLKDEGKSIPPIYMAVGTEDFLYENNQVMRKFLEDNDANMKYEEGPGIHDWKFWNKYIYNGVEWVLNTVG